MFRKILTAVTLILVALVVWSARNEVLEAIAYLANTNIWFIILLIPEQLFMYYCAGQIFFSYMAAKKDAKKISNWTLMRISFELNFVNNAVPSGGFSGLGYIAWRLAPYGSSAGQTSFMYILRYVITILANQTQTMVAILALVLMGTVPTENRYMLWLVAIICTAVVIVMAIMVVIVGNKKRIDWFANIVTKFVNFLVRKITFGHKKKVLKDMVVRKYCMELHAAFLEAKEHKNILKAPIIWGVVYSFLEVATYWLVAISMGHPEFLPQIMVAEAIGSIFGAILPTPGGAGGYEASMAGVMWALGVDLGLATAVVITTRVIVLVGTIASGYGFYQYAISKLNKKEIKEIEETEKVEETEEIRDTKEDE